VVTNLASNRIPVNRISFDTFLTVITATLLVACPFAFGAVHRWAYTTVEIVVFSLVALWLLVGITSSDGIRGKCNYHGAWSLFAAAAAFLVLIAMQLIPMPPRVLQIVSPRTYALYASPVNGWPGSLPTVLGPLAARAATVGDGNTGRGNAPASKSSATATSDGRRDSIHRGGWVSGLTSWRPLSIAPSLTMYALVEAIAYISFFFLILTYRFDHGTVGETRFLRAILVTLAICGVLLSITGITEQVYWNGKILWFFVPHDWSAPHYGSLLRVSGPFVNPDHFANYLGMIFPLTAECTLFGLPGSRQRRVGDIWLSTRFLFGLTSFLILLAIVLSLSRAIWLLAVLSILAFGLLGPSAVPSPVPAFRTDAKGGFSRVLRQRKLRSIGAALMISLLLVPLAGVLIGTSHDSAVAQRVGKTAGDPGLGIGVRPALWTASIHMFQDHPLAGVGLGAWAEILPHYELPPRLEMAFHQAHNDYLQLAAEVGIFGLIPFIFTIFWLGHACGLIRRVSYDRRPLLLALCIAVAVMLLHELVDFAMHITANALLFTLLLALAIRIAARMRPGPEWKVPGSWLAAAGQMALVCAAYGLLVWLAARPQNVDYPADLGQPDSVRRATEIIFQHPASAESHMDRFGLLGAANWPAADIDDLASAVWLDPTDPYDRDLYASALDERGAMPESLQTITASMFNSPDISSHYYLEPALLKRLSSDQRGAVEKGLVQAMDANEPGAVPALAWIYDTLGDFGAEAEVYELAAQTARDFDQRAQDYDLAGQAARKGARAREARRDFSLAVANDPSNTQAYNDLFAVEVAALTSSAAIITGVQAAINNGADPVALWTTLASAYQAAGDNDHAEKALLNAVALNPSYEMLVRTGQFYSAQHQFDRAAGMFRKAIAISPDSAAAYHDLGAAQEGAYEYSQADEAYGEAAKLAPAQYRSGFLDFHKRMALAGQMK
jgi:O-antigen ligase/tetratricopeptide (TPR) repeat protein